MERDLRECLLFVSVQLRKDGGDGRNCQCENGFVSLSESRDGEMTFRIWRLKEGKRGKRWRGW